MPSLRALAALFAVVLLLPACDSAEAFEIGGTYSGTIVATDTPGFDASVTVVIPETETGASFSFSITGAQEGATVTSMGRGTYDHPSISLVVEDGIGQDDVATGTVSDDGDTITLDAGDGPFTLRRQ